MQTENAGLVTVDPGIVANVALRGDISGLTPQQKIQYLGALCSRLGLDPVTQPLKIMKLQGKETIYADRGCAAQLNRLHNLSSEIKSTEKVDDLYIVNSRATSSDGRFTDEIGAVCITGLKGEALANAIMKCRTKAMRRATLTHVGLGLLDEEEAASVLQEERENLPEGKVLTDEGELLHEWTPEEKDALMNALEDMDNLAERAGETNEARDKAQQFYLGQKAQGIEPEKVLSRISAACDKLQSKIKKAEVAK